jgi:archaellum component FlaD/FlaE
MGLWNWFGGTMDEGDEESAGSDATVDVAGGAGVADDTDAVPDDDGPDLVELEHRVGELEEGLERDANRIESVQHSQEEVADRVEEMNETVRDLLGVYDRLTSDVNPFLDGEVDGEAGRFGVVNGNGDHGSDPDRGAYDVPDEPVDERTPEPAGDVAEARDGADTDGADVREDGPAADDVFGFEDVVADLEGDEASSGAGGTDDTAEATVGTEAPRTTNGDSATGRGAGGEEPTDGAPYLDDLADDYAADVLVLEWLAELVETTGPAAALKAISYYEDVGWIGPSVAADLEEYLAGPGIDVHVDPSEPTELTVEDHATSYEYILKLDAIHELEHTA